MKQLQFSTSDRFADAESLFDKIANMDPSLDLHAFTTTTPWPIMSSFLQRAALDQGGLDVSEIGSTWVGIFSRMDALGDFTPDEVQRIGGEHRFLPACWRSATLLDDRRVLSIPWMAETRLVFYWKDALERAGIDEKFAFDTPVQMEETLERIAASGQPAWAAPTFAVNNALHQIVSWVWGAGGGFLTPDGRATEFLNPDAFEGICSYFRLHRFLAARFNSLDAVTETFESRHAAVTISGPWFLKRMALRGATQDEFDNLGVALPPGPPVVLGSNLVVWKRVAGEARDNAISWIAHLLSPRVQREICDTTGLLPVFSDVWEDARYASHSHYNMFRQALEKGRPLPRISKWGSLEEELIRAIGNIWSNLKEDPRLDVNETVLQFLAPVAKQFDRALSSN